MRSNKYDMFFSLMILFRLNYNDLNTHVKYKVCFLHNGNVFRGYFKNIYTGIMASCYPRVRAINDL